MGDERSRTREPEPEQETKYDQASEEYAEDRERTTYPYVKRDEDLPWETGRHAKLKYYSDPYSNDTVLPQVKVFRQEIAERNGRHTHQGGIVLFGLSGEATTVVDGERVAWQAGDLVLLPITPKGLEHQHFNHRDPDDPAEWLAIYYRPYKTIVGNERIQHETAPWWEGDDTDEHDHQYDFTIDRVNYDEWLDYDPPDEPASLFDDLFVRRNLHRQTLARSQEHDNWVKVGADQLEWEWSPMGKLKWYLHPAHDDRSMQTLLFAIQEVPPGSRSGKLHRQGGMIHYMLEGEGHTIVDGERHEWGSDDFLGLPIKIEGHTVQHFNDDPTQPMRFLVAEPFVHEAVGYDLGCGMELLEPCPEYDGDLPENVYHI